MNIAYQSTVEIKSARLKLDKCTKHIVKLLQHCIDFKDNGLKQQLLNLCNNILQYDKDICYNEKLRQTILEKFKNSAPVSNTRLI